MAVKRGLGKGLGALIPEGEDKAPEKTKVVEKIVEKKVVVKEPAEVYLKINEVEPNRDQPRTRFDEDALHELADSIKQYGIIQPLIVKKREDYYEIIAGERRWRAAKIAGLKQVPVVIKDYSEQQIMEVALIENIQREDLNPIEEAQAYQRLIKEYNLKQDEVAEKVSKSRTAITNSMRLLKLDERVQKMLVDEMISSGHARALLGIEDGEKQYNIALKVFDERLSVREVEKLVKNINKPEKRKEVILPENDFVYRDMEEKLKEAVGTKVVIHNKNNNKGKIEIEYYSQDDFERIVELLKRK
ncbi:MAG: ParB/RepB/Spo0J family partition protein [Butyrivibrio sp.]